MRFIKWTALMARAYKHIKLYSIKFSYCHLLVRYFFFFRFYFIICLQHYFFCHMRRAIHKCEFYYHYCVSQVAKCIINKCDGFRHLISGRFELSAVAIAIAITWTGCCFCFNWKSATVIPFGIDGFSHIIHVNQPNRIAHCLLFFPLLVSFHQFNFCSLFRHTYIYIYISLLSSPSSSSPQYHQLEISTR